MIANLGGGWTYFVFGCINFIAIIFFVKFVPETKNHSLRNSRFTSKSNTAKRSPT